MHFKSTLTTVVFVALAAPSFAASMESSPRPKARPIDLVMPVKLVPCAILLTDTVTGAQWYDDGTPAGTGKLPKQQYASPLDAWAWIDTTIKASPSAEEIQFTPVCFNP